MFNQECPVFLVTGFLEAGKTTFLNDTLHQEYFQVEGKTLLILTEEGEVEYDEEELLAKTGTVIEVIEDQEDFNKTTLRNLTKKHKPTRIIIEYNPMWSVKKFYEMKHPWNWTILQHIVIVDGETFDLYMKNWMPLFSEMIQRADTIIYNRCREDQPLANYRRSCKVIAPGADVIFENMDGDIMDIFQGEMPFDIEEDPFTVEDMDFGVWYVDMMDNPDKYEGKNARFKAQVLKHKEDDADFFAAGRRAMTCCAADTQFIGFVCRTPLAERLKAGQWVEVTGTIHQEFAEAYGKEGPVIRVTEVREAEAPAEEMVYFT